jgi:integrase
MKKSNGPFRCFIDRYLQLRRSLGAILQDAEYTLNHFDLYLSKCFPRTKTVTKPMIVGYLQTCNVHASTIYNRFVELRQFCRFLFQLNPHNYVPEPRLFREGPTIRVPHIYTREEAIELIRLARARACVPKGSLRPHTFCTLLSLLWVSGLRIREALRLNLEDVDTDAAVLHIRETKFFKSRLVPVALSTATALESYKRLRAEHGYDRSPSAPFFINDRARRCSYSLVSSEFRALLRQLGIRTVQGRYPRLHDFRHTFATRYLNEIYKKGKDPGASLPLLATYLGHVNISHTQVYLHPSSGLLADVGQKFYEHVHKSDNHMRGGKDEEI